MTRHLQGQRREEGGGRREEEGEVGGLIHTLPDTFSLVRMAIPAPHMLGGPNLSHPNFSRCRNPFNFREFKG